MGLMELISARSNRGESRIGRVNRKEASYVSVLTVVNEPREELARSIERVGVAYDMARQSLTVSPIDGPSKERKLDINMTLNIL